MRTLLVSLVAALLLFAPLTAQEHISVESTVDRQEITIGDLVTYKVTITADTSLQVDSLEVGENLGGFEIKDYIPREERIRDSYRIITEGFEITTFTTGEYQIPPLTISYLTPAGERKSVATDPLPITVKSLLTGEDAEDIHSLKGPRAFEPDTPWWLIIIAAVVLAAVALFVYLYRRARKPIDLLAEEIDPRLPWEIALEDLGELKASDLIAKGQFKLFYLRLSEIFRAYLERRYGISALERTTWEIIHEFRALSLPEAEEKLIGGFLNECDLVKFAKFIPSSEQAAADLERGREFVLQTRSLPHTSVVGKQE
ncbi:MAG: BatD family protein [bacterium]